ncbi:unnamed protein product [Hermetia illucens]|uniref:Kazal-like domain-containing protein n=1 Tax=Hermetia illucens TaxID=343691 RepID=A0A7R8YQ08_HERIL|nr:uncharacterized protein LOC119649401 [Hermetia illucens]CAD7081321.1 unnamed protein product [Hermetia illucens]
MLLRTVILTFALYVALCAAQDDSAEPPPVCHIQCGSNYKPVCVQMPDMIVREFTNSCHLSLFNCRNRANLQSNVPCVIDRIEKMVSAKLKLFERKLRNQGRVDIPERSRVGVREMRNLINAFRAVVSKL